MNSEDSSDFADAQPCDPSCDWCYPEEPAGKAVEHPPRALVLQEAETLICGDRNITYGPPTENLKNISELWTVRLKHKLGDEIITPSDVADLMVLLKIARNVADTKRDNYVDIAGYAGCGWECYEAEIDEG